MKSNILALSLQQITVLNDGNFISILYTLSCTISFWLLELFINTNISATNSSCDVEFMPNTLFEFEIFTKIVLQND